MKKYLLGIIAVAMAIGFSSFSTAKTAVKNKSFTTLNYWFYDQTSGLGAFAGQYIKNSLELEEATCEDNGGIPCVKGYSPGTYSENNPPAGSQVMNAAQDTRAHN